MRKFIFVIFVVATLALLSLVDKKEPWSKSYEEGLRYEKGFRDLALITFGDLQDDSDDAVEQTLWHLLYELELHSQETMAPLRAKHGIPSEISFKTKILCALVDGALLIMPDTFWRYLEGSAERFIVQLKGIKAKGPSEDQPLLSYMVEQEETVLLFLQHYNQGNTDAAMEVIKQKHRAYYADSILKP